MPDELEGLTDAWLDEEFEESPVRASQLGADGYDDRLGDYSEAGFARRDARTGDASNSSASHASIKLSRSAAIERTVALELWTRPKVGSGTVRSSSEP